MAENQNKTDYEERKAWYRRYDIKTGRLAIVGLVGILLLVIAMYLINQYFLATTQKQIQQVQLAPPSDTLEQLNIREDSLLTMYRLIDSTNGTYQIPITEAMKILADSAAATAPKSKREH